MFGMEGTRSDRVGIWSKTVGSGGNLVALSGIGGVWSEWIAPGRNWPEYDRNLSDQLIYLRMGGNMQGIGYLWWDFVVTGRNLVGTHPTGSGWVGLW